MLPFWVAKTEVRWTRRLKEYLITGLFIVVPIGLTFLVVKGLVILVDANLSPIVESLVGRHVPGLGLIAALLVVLGAGMLGSHVVGQALLEFGQRLILMVPGLNWIYQTIKQMFDAFSPDAEHSFRQVVLVEYPRPGAWSLGFVTKEVRIELEGGPAEDRVSVYIPTNHLYLGEYAVFRKAELLPTEMSVQDGIRATLTAGAALPDVIRARKPG